MKNEKWHANLHANVSRLPFEPRGIGRIQKWHANLHAIFNCMYMSVG